MDELLEQFLIEGPELVQQATDDLLTLERSPSDAETLNAIFRAFHTLKGSVGLFDVAPMGALLQVAEDVLVGLRSGAAPVTRIVIDGLLATAAQCDRWLDDLARTGSLGAGAEEASRRLVGDLRAGLDLAQVPAAPASAADWVLDLVQRHADKLNGPAVALRYAPDPQAYFNGDDPLALVQAAPGLIAVQVSLREPSAGDYDPFTCNLVFEALSSASLAAVQGPFRLVRDQATFIEVATPASAMARAEAAKTMRVDVARIDAMADLVGELVVAKNGLAELAARDQSPALRDAQATLDRLTGALHRRVMELRMTALSPVLRRLRPLAREIAAGLGKDVEFTIHDHQTEADKAIVDGLYEPLLHIVRNAIDHGLESPQERLAGGKTGRGSVTLTARVAASQVLIDIADDGRGIDPDHIRRVAVRRGLIDEAAAQALSDAQAIDLIFAPGFSTAETVSAVSGRGVGMDAVRAATLALGGKVSVHSVKGQGSTFTLALPMTLVMTKIMIVSCGADRFGVPLDQISETVQVLSTATFPVRHGRAFLLRETPIPLLHLAQLLGGEAPVGKREFKVVIIEARGERIGIAVDGLVDRMDAITRPLAGLLAGAPGVAGSTLLGDGQVLLVLDLAELAA